MFECVIDYLFVRLYVLSGIKFSLSLFIELGESVNVRILNRNSEMKSSLIFKKNIVKALLVNMTVLTFLFFFIFHFLIFSLVYVNICK